MALFLLLFNLATAHMITPPPHYPSAPTSYPNVAVGHHNPYNHLPGAQLFKRSTDSCDDHPDGFACPTGTCYTATSNGWIGCCSTTSCAPRTTCIEYAATPTTSCDVNYGGCLQCLDPANGKCYTETNVVAGQYIFYCASVAGTGTVSWVNGRTTSKMVEASTTTVVVAETPTPTASKEEEGGVGGLSTGAIAGIAVGSAVGFVLLLAALWFFRRKILPSHSKKIPVGFRNPFGGRSSTTKVTMGSTSSDEKPLPSETSKSTHDDTALPDQQATFTDANDNRTSRYTVTNPDTILVSPTVNGRVEAPSHPSPQVSPLAHSFSTPKTNSGVWQPSPTSSRIPSQQYIPYSPSAYGTEPPSSVARPPPPSMPQGYSAARFPYTPGGSGLPQDYSNATLASRSEVASWPYLSAEDALAGGWTNEGSPKQDRKA